MTTDIWLAIGVCVFVALTFTIALLVQRGNRPARSTDMKIDDVSRRFADFDRRLTTTEHDVKNVRMVVGALATKDSVNGVSVQVAELRGDMKALVQQSATTAHSVGRMEDFLMKSSAEAIVAAKSTAEAMAAKVVAEAAVIAKGAESKG